MAPFLLLLFLATLSQAADPTIRRLDGTRLPLTEAARIAKAELERAKVTGAQIVILDRGQVVWRYAHGLRRVEGALPMQTNTNTWAASITKGVFAVYAMQLVERGQLSLDIPLATQLSQPLTSYPAYKDSATAIVNDPNWQKITPRMLLSHTSSLHNFPFLEPDQKLHLHATPGSTYRYSGEGLNLVQLLIEEKQKRPLDQLTQDAFFTPLGMSQTGMIYRSEFAPNVADRYGAQGQFLNQTRRFPARASGNMSSSADDLAKFAQALMSGKLLGPKAYKELLRPQIQIRSTQQFEFPPSTTESPEAKAVGLAYGFGWGLYTKTPYGKAFFKEGHGDGAQNYMLCFPKRQACIIILTNSDNGELAFRPLMEKLWANTITPWHWHSYDFPAKN